MLDINPTPGKFLRSLYSPRRKLVFGTPDTSTLQEIADLAGRGKLGISIGRSVKLDEAIALIGELKAGRRTKGKAVIVMA